uniref:Uncharacterized protein n=1 Tax=Setaria viridis TaxID=4556 RepID=A0A4U6T0H7_SETVI|nr:hypothetical protein SEVIR_9G329850v2 [Setaria viridis]
MAGVPCRKSAALYGCRGGNHQRRGKRAETVRKQIFPEKHVDQWMFNGLQTSQSGFHPFFLFQITQYSILCPRQFFSFFFIISSEFFL